MSTASAVNFIDFSAPGFKSRLSGGWERHRITATINSGSASCTITNIPNLCPDSNIWVAQQGASGATARLIEIGGSGNRVNGPVGTLTIGTADGSSVSSNTNFMMDVINF